jgi:MiaB/RimO family radical SAM methylthiotransferase
MKTFSITTLGCRVNHYESEQLATLLRARGLVQVPPPRADLRVVHTCSVTSEAASKSRQTVRRNTRLPVLPATSTAGAVAGPACAGATNPAAAIRDVTSGLSLSDRSSNSAEQTAATIRPRVIVTGCWATSDPKEAAALPGVDAVLGHHQDLGLELTRLLTQWETQEQTPDSPTSLVLEHAESVAGPESNRNDGWMIEEAGTPAGLISSVNEPHRATEVNGKLDRRENPCEANHEDQAKPPSPARRRALGTVTLPQLHARQTTHQRAFLKVQDGCDAHCTYCIIPQLRPALWSKPIDDAVAEAIRLTHAGHAELVLTGIFLGAYGHETALRRRQHATQRLAHFSGACPLADLVTALCQNVPRLRRLRLSSLEPGDLTPDLIATLRRHPQVVPHFHLPLQSGSDAILRRMNRQYTRADFLDMVAHLTAAFDRPAITTDVIVGFPGETDDDFARTLDVVDAARFIHIHAFPYSPRPRTAAARWTDHHIPGPVASARLATLRARAADHALAFRRSFLGQTVEVLVEHANANERDTAPLAGHQHGRSERYFPVHFRSMNLPAGTPVTVRITEVTPTHTLGIPV